MRFYGPAQWLDYYDTHEIMCALYYTSCCIQQNYRMHFIEYYQVRSEVHSWLHSIVNSNPAWHTLPTNLSRFSQVHSKYAPKYTSKYILKYTPVHALKDSINCTWWHSPSLLDCTLPSKLSSTLPRTLSRTLPIALDGKCSLLDYTLASKLSRCSQAHSQARSLGWCQLPSMAHSQAAWLYAPE